jgi:CRP-like cAMP-binding protein
MAVSASRSFSNHLLAGLPPAESERIARDLEPVSLAFADVLYEQDEVVRQLYFPESGVISMVTVMDDGNQVEAAIVGKEGMVALPPFAGQRSPWRTVVQVADSALAVPAEGFTLLLVDLPALRNRIMQYAAALIAMTTQTAACQRFHHVEQRLIRWLLMVDERTEGHSIRMTQEFLSSMLGTQRPVVTSAAGALQERGLIAYHRGQIQILDRPGLERASCECYARICQRFERLNQEREA